MRMMLPFSIRSSFVYRHELVVDILLCSLRYSIYLFITLFIALLLWKQYRAWPGILWLMACDKARWFASRASGKSRETSLHWNAREAVDITRHTAGPTGEHGGTRTFGREFESPIGRQAVTKSFFGQHFCWDVVGIVIYFHPTYWFAGRTRWKSISRFWGDAILIFVGRLGRIISGTAYLRVRDAPTRTSIGEGRPISTTMTSIRGGEEFLSVGSQKDIGMPYFFIIVVQCQLWRWLLRGVV